MEKINIEGIELINDSNTLNQLRKTINEAIDKRIETINLASFANDLSNKSFGYLKECFESMAPSLYSYTDGKKLLSKYTNIMKENKNLKQLHSIYENLRKVGKGCDLQYFFDNFTNYDWNIDKKTLKEDTKTLGDIVAEAYLYETYMGNDISLPIEKENLDYAIEYVVENKMTSTNLSKYTSALQFIKENVEKNENVFKFVKPGLNSKIDNMVNEFNEKYNDLSEDEIHIVNEITNSSNPEEVFNKYKENCKSKIEEKREVFKNDNDVNSLKRIDALVEQISKKDYSQETLVDDINNLIEISNIFN